MIPLTLLSFLTAILFVAALYSGCLSLLHRRKLERALREIDEWKIKSNLVFNSMGEGMYGLDLEGRVLFVNAAAARMLGFSPDGLIGKKIDEMIRPPSDSARQLSPRANVDDHFGVKVQGEFFRRRDGSLLPVDYTCSPIVEENNITGAVYIFRDDTERVVQEERLQAYLCKIESINRELREATLTADAANRAKSLFLANMSHEIRTPLNGVIGAASLLERTTITEQQQKYIRRITLSGRVLLEILNDVLDVSKIEAGQLKLEMIPADLPQLIHEVAEVLSHKAEEKGLNLTISIDANTPTYVVMDVVRLRQVITNLVYNAIKFTEKGFVQVVVVGQPPVEGRSLVHIEIRDSGIGIALEKQDKLFRKFYQADASTTRRFGGTGLGLAISKCLVELMEGEIGFSSAEGEGSIFWIDIPFAVSVVTKEASS